MRERRGAESPEFAPGTPLAFHPPCTLQHGQQLRGGVEQILAALDFDVRLAASESHLCCGSAGTYSVLQPAIATQLRDRKLAALAASQPDPRAIVSANISCISHLQSGTPTPVRHWIEAHRRAAGGMSAVVLIPTTGAPSLRRAVESVLAQTVPAAPYVVCDGPQFRDGVDAALHGLDVPVCVLPRNVGGGGFYGHRVYAAFAHLVDEEHVLFLDQDNFLAPEHVAQCIDLIAARRLQWCYSLRNIRTPAGGFVCRDDCESLGKWPAFTNTH